MFDPNSGAVQAKVSLGGQAELDKAVAAAQAAQPAWAATNPQRRARVMFAFKALVEANMDELARMLSSEHGKVIADAKTDRVLGVWCIASVAGTMIAQAAQAMEFGATSEDIAYTCHAHPTHSEAIKEAAMAVQGKPIHI